MLRKKIEDCGAGIYSTNQLGEQSLGVGGGGARK